MHRFWKNIFLLIRSDQYIKNTFIFIPLFFSLKINDLNLLINAAYAFFAFSLITSSVYIFNDLNDIEEDCLHPKKKFRPIASRSVTKLQASMMMVLLFLLGLTLSYILIPSVIIIVLAYTVFNILYTLYLKKVPIIDVAIISSGFVMRIFIGSNATGVALSEWIIIMTFLLALFLALAKRREDVNIFLNTGNKTRKVVENYNLQFLDISMATMASVVIVAYIGYTTSAAVVKKLNSEYIYLTSLFVILGIMRYLQFIYVKHESGSPTKIVLKDRFIQLTILCWGASFVLMLYKF